MIRDYSDKRLNELKKEIKSIQRHDFSKFTDEVGDAFYYLGSWIGLLDAEDYVHDINAYHRKVLDQHDTSVGKLTAIFACARGVDITDARTMEQIVSAARSYNTAMKALVDAINPQNSNFDLKTLKGLSKKITDETKNSEKFVSKTFKSTIKELENDLAKDSAKGLVFSTLSMVGGVFEFTVCAAKGDTAGAAAATWNMIDDMFDTGQNLSALAVIGISKGLSALGVKTRRLYGYEEAEKMYNADGLAGQFAIDGYEGAERFARKLDLAAAGVGLYSSAEGFVGGADKTARLIGNDSLTSSTKIKILADEYLTFGFSKIDYDGTTIIGDAKNKKNFLKNLGYSIDLIGLFSEGDCEKIYQKFIEKQELIGFSKDANDFFDDALDLVLN